MRTLNLELAVDDINFLVKALIEYGFNEEMHSRNKDAPENTKKLSEANARHAAALASDLSRLGING